MLKYRIVTALLLIPLVVGGIFWASTPVFAALLSVVVLLGAWEWSRLMGLIKYWQRGLYLLLIALLLLAGVRVQSQPDLIREILGVTVLLWCVISGWIIYLNQTGPVSRKDLPLLLSALMGVWLLLPTWLSLIHLHGSSAAGPVWLLLLMLLIWGADSGAYFSGRLWGRHKLAVQVSPGKTWEGVGGGLVLALLLVLPLTQWFLGRHESGTLLHQSQTGMWYTLLCFVTIVFSVCGDLLESVVKRRAGVKDSGHILPGHGGVLDRIDSLTAAAPFFTLGLLLLGLISGAGA